MEQIMKKKLLCCALLGAVSMAQSAFAQDYDDRWYLTGGVGYNWQDSDRSTEDTMFYTLGFGKFISPNWSLDLELNHQNPSFKDNSDLNFSQYGGSIDARYHWIKEGRNWWPFVRMGLGVQSADEEFDAFPNPNSPGEREDTFLAANLGVGLQADYDRYAVRADLGSRFAFDDSSVVAPDEDSFMDITASLTFLVKLGDRIAPVVSTPPPQQTCADLDDDGDGVNNCNDKCPGSTAGQAIGPDGCPVPVSIDLRGVNFDFDKDTLRPDAIAILDEAIAILQKYPQMRFELAGHTDECGSDPYNQGLSERRARVVYDYLTGHGIDAGRISGPNGYGESRPLEQLGDAFPGCKSETNRRTELNVQN
jgi:OOP family OmpA-OmpF porin